MEKEKIHILPEGVINPHFIPKDSRYVITSTGFLGKTVFFQNLKEAINFSKKKKEKIFKLKKTYKVFSATKNFDLMRVG